MNNVKVHVLGALIIAISVIIIGLSGSYAYYVNEIHNTNESNQGVTVKGAGAEAFKLTFNSSSYISVTDAKLMTKDQAKASSNKTEFTVAIADASKMDKATYTLKIKDIKMNSQYKSSTLSWIKWVLVKVSGTSETEVKEGDFTNLTFNNTAGTDNMYTATNDITITKDPVTINKGSTDSYKLYVWLNNDPSTNQTSLLNGSMTMEVGIEAISK